MDQTDKKYCFDIQKWHMHTTYEYVCFLNEFKSIKRPQFHNKMANKYKKLSSIENIFKACLHEEFQPNKALNTISNQFKILK